ncbi:unnamed protein product [Paramecium sonneborni]|uniref:Uncharacterized protein n=1 Tax=Paramecium sonneborni TaxID=65129 RepID=A0A8S1KFG8_9CILI|nr:unnamed protein product [Paramecium sonneborni]
MDKTQITNSSLLIMKREIFRNKLRKEFLEKRFKNKRSIKIKAVFEQIMKIQDAKNDEENQDSDSASDQNQISEESCDYFAVFQIGRTHKRQKLTYKILKSMKQYLQKNTTYQSQMFKVFMFCEEQLLNTQQENIEYIPLLAEIIFLLQNYSTKFETQPFIVLLRAFTKHQEYSILQFIESLIFHNPILITQLEEFCQIKEDYNLIKLLCEKITYANLKMILFLLNTLKNKDIFKLFEFYGLKKMLLKNIDNQNNYEKLRFQILSTTGWNEDESDNQSYQIFGDAPNVY